MTGNGSELKPNGQLEIFPFIVTTYKWESYHHMSECIVGELEYKMDIGHCFNLRILEGTDLPDATEAGSSIILSSKGFKVVKFWICSDICVYYMYIV